MYKENTQRGSAGIIITAIVAVLALTGVAYYNSSSKSERVASVPPDKELVATHESASIGDENMMDAGTYESYASEKIAKATTGKVVLFFHASWCPSCKVLTSDIELHLGAIPENLTILDVDYDNSIALKKQYGVTFQHTFVQVDAGGKLIKKWSGSPTLAALVAEVR